MKMKIIEMLQRAHGACRVLTAGLFLLGGLNSVRAGWTASNTSHAWSGYNNNFKFIDNGYEWHFSDSVGSGTVEPNTFWQQAEKIELAVDAYEWARTYDSGNLPSYKQEVEGLCDGFVESHGDDWSSDPFDDDLAWACVAFMRAYGITGTTRWLTDAENNYNTIWSRGVDSSDWGIWWDYQDTNTSSDKNAYKNSAANWTFVIAGYYIYQATGSTPELNRANSVYGFCKQYLYNSSNGEVYDHYGYPNNTDTAWQFSYNYGVCIGAATFKADSGTIGNAAVYLAYGMDNYEDGYLLPLYQAQAANDNDGGFNGIAMRWLGFAIASGYEGAMGPGVVSWAQANVSQAWSERDSQELVWDDWGNPTPAASSSNHVYSWDCSSAMAGMFDIPMP